MKSCFSALNWKKPQKKQTVATTSTPLILDDSEMYMFQSTKQQSHADEKKKKSTNI